MLCHHYLLNRQRDTLRSPEPANGSALGLGIRGRGKTMMLTGIRLLVKKRAMEGVAKAGVRPGEEKAMNET